jgi:hypothetical protein
MESRIESNPTPRIIGIVWLLYFAVGAFSIILIRGLFVSGDTAATSQNLLAHAMLFQAATSLDLVGNALYIVLTALLYGLFRRVDRSLALMAAFFSLAGCIVQITAGLLRFAPSVVLTDTQLTGVFSLQQLQTAALVGLGLYRRVVYISFPLFALFDLVTGLLILRSTFLPRWLGVWWVVAGAGNLIFLWPPLAMSIQPVIIGVGGGAELVFALWLIVKNADILRRRAEANA